jgi:hypothetical protein
MAMTINHERERTMTSLDTLRELHAELKAKVDIALDAMPEYRQMRALEEVIVKMETITGSAVQAMKAAASEPATHTVQGMASTVIRRAGEPLPLQRIFEYVDGIKKFPDKKKARVNVVSVLSKGKMLKAVHWRGQHAWWFANEPLPKEQNTGASP